MNEKMLKIFEVIIRKYNNEERFNISDIAELAEIKSGSVSNYLKEIIGKFPKCFKLDNKRKPFEYLLLDRSFLIKSLIKEIIPKFLFEFIEIIYK